MPGRPRKPSSISGGLNYLGELRLRAGLSQSRLATLLGRDTSAISRLERARPDFFRSQRDLIVHWAAACGAGQADVELQEFLMNTGNAPLVPDAELANIAALAAVAGLPPELTRRQIGIPADSGKPEFQRPKVFVSHASEDKVRFVLPFATKLRERGIDAWVDRWEILPGDSLIDRIFEEGLKEASAVIVVLSRSSVAKPWVREELNAAFVKRVEGKTKLIPVIIDECDVPEALRSTVWQKISNLNSYDHELSRIVMAIYGASNRPALGIPPTYTRTAIDTVPGLDPVDSLVLKAIGDVKMTSPYTLPHPEDLQSRLADADVDSEVLLDSLEVLENRHYIDATRTMTHDYRGIRCVQATHFGFDQYARTYVPDYRDAVQAVSLALVNTETRDFAALATIAHKPQVLVEHILETMAQRNLVHTTKTMGGGWVIKVSPELRRSLERR